MGDSLALYRRLVAGQVRSQLEYRTSFFATILATALISGIDFVAVLVLFENVPTLGGWTVSQVAVLYGLSTVAFACADLVVGHLDHLDELIRTGAFDLLLLRPRGTLLQVIASDFAVRRLGRAAQGLAVLTWGLARADIAWTPVKVILLPLGVASASAIFAAVWVFVVCLVFWVVEGRETTNTFTDGGTFMAQYPLDIFSEWLRRLLAYVIPMAFVSYLPASYLLDKPPPAGFPTWLPFTAPAVAVIAGIVAGVTWTVAVRHYRSAGG